MQLFKVGAKQPQLDRGIERRPLFQLAHQDLRFGKFCIEPLLKLWNEPLGGIGILPGAVVGGIVLGIVEAFISGLGFSMFRDAAAFAILILVLLIRPAGIFGKNVKEKV